MNEKIVAILRTGHTQRDLPRVVDALRSFDEIELFGTLFPLSVMRQEHGFPVAFGAYALNELNPKCLLGAREAVEQLLPSWDVSIEEVVFYLAKQFGVQALEKTLDELCSSNQTQELLTPLGTIAYWLNIYGSEGNRDATTRQETL